MIWLLTRLVVLPVKAAAGGFKLGYLTGRVLGYRRILLVGVGVAAGVLFAPGPGVALRDRLRSSLGGGTTAPPPAPPRPATPTVTSTPDPVAPAPPVGTTSAVVVGTDAASSPEAVDVITASGSGVVASAAGDDGITDDGAGDEPVGEEAPVGVVESLPPQVDAEPLPAVPDADPAVDTPPV